MKAGPIERQQYCDRCAPGRRPSEECKMPPGGDHLRQSRQQDEPQRSGPVELDLMKEAENDKDGQRRQGEDGSKLLRPVRRAPECLTKPGRRDEYRERRRDTYRGDQKQDRACEKMQRKFRGGAETPGGLEGKRSPLMGSVPGDDRRKEQERDGCTQIGPGAPEPPAGSRIEQEEDEDRRP